MNNLDQLLDRFAEPTLPPPAVEKPKPIVPFPYGREWFEVFYGRKAVKFYCEQDSYTAYVHNDGEVWLCPDGAKSFDDRITVVMTDPQINYYISSGYWK